MPDTAGTETGIACVTTERSPVSVPVDNTGLTWVFELAAVLELAAALVARVGALLIAAYPVTVSTQS
jgi:hypothetical protein